jgi:membrane fusion protein (multidrug efflux system)
MSLRDLFRGKRAIASASVFAALVISGVALQGWSSSGTEWTNDAFVEGTLTYLAPEIAARVEEVLVDDHAHVAKGQPLVRLERSSFEARLARSQADLAAAANQMAAAEAAAASADAERKAASVELWRSERELERVASMLQRGAASQQQLDAARATRDAAEARGRALELRAAAERAVLGNEAPLRQAEADLRQAQLDLEHTLLVAPFDGTIGRKKVAVGDLVRPGQSLLALAREGDTWIVANFKETQIRNFAIGSGVEIHIDAFPGVTWRGRVDSFSPASGSKFALIPAEPAAGTFTKVVQRIPVKIAIEGSRGEDSKGAPPPQLAIGLSAEVWVGGT